MNAKAKAKIDTLARQVARKVRPDLFSNEVAEELAWAANLLGMAADDFEELGQPQKAASLRTHADKMHRVLAKAVQS